MPRLVLLATLSLGLIGCAASHSVRRMDANETRDLSGRWNDTDSRLVAEEMINDSLSRPWVQQAQAKFGRIPTVIVGTVRNQSMEHIATDTFVEDLQRTLINSGRITFVASRNERDEMRAERLDQDTNASEDSRKAHGQEKGADFMLSGTINSIVDREGGESVVLYQINLKLVDLESNQIVWNGQKKIRKNIVRADSSW